MQYITYKNADEFNSNVRFRGTAPAPVWATDIRSEEHFAVELDGIIYRLVGLSIQVTSCGVATVWDRAYVEGDYEQQDISEGVAGEKLNGLLVATVEAICFPYNFNGV